MDDHLRIGDAERAEALDQLGEHFAQGRLDRDEYDERSDAVWSARTRSDLAGLFADLPGQPTRQVGRTGPAGSPRQGGHLRRTGGPRLLPVLLVLVLIAVVARAPHVPGLLIAGVLLFVFLRRRVEVRRRGSRR